MFFDEEIKKINLLRDDYIKLWKDAVSVSQYERKHIIELMREIQREIDKIIFSLPPHCLSCIFLKRKKVFKIPILPLGVKCIHEFVCERGCNEIETCPHKKKHIEKLYKKYRVIH